MARVRNEFFLGRSVARLARLSLSKELNSLKEALTFPQEQQKLTRGQDLRKALDQVLGDSGEWLKKAVGLTWCRSIWAKSFHSSIGLERRFTGNPDLLLSDVLRLSDALVKEEIDVGILAVLAKPWPTEKRTRPDYEDAMLAVERCRAQEMAIVVLGIELDAN